MGDTESKLANEYFMDMMSGRVYATNHNPGYFDIHNPEKDIGRKWAPWISNMTDMTKEKISGHCYEYSTVALMGLDDNARLVRGNMYYPGYGETDHGWVEFDFERQAFVYNKWEKEILSKREHDAKYPIRKIYYTGTKKSILDVFLADENVDTVGNILLSKKTPITDELRYEDGQIAIARKSQFLMQDGKVKRCIIRMTGPHLGIEDAEGETKNGLVMRTPSI